MHTHIGNSNAVMLQLRFVFDSNSIRCSATYDEIDVIFFLQQSSKGCRVVVVTIALRSNWGYLS